VDQAEGFGDRLARGVREGLVGFRRRDKYFKAQAAILGAWLAISIVTVAAVAWAGRTQNELGAEVRAETPIGGTVLLVTNTSDTAWTDVTYTLNGVYVARQAALAPHDHASLPLKRFRKGGAAGKHPPHDTVPQVLAIRCEQGQFQTALGAPAPAQ
jgi:hypothetical protein